MISLSKGTTSRERLGSCGASSNNFTASPGVFEVAQAECAPLAHDFSADHFTLPGRSDQIPIEYNHVTPNYFALIGIPIMRGRDFAPAGTHDPTGVIVTESTARRL